MTQNSNNVFNIKTLLLKIFVIIKKFFINTLPDFIKSNFEFNSTKKSKIIGAVISAVLLIVVVVFNQSFIGKTSSSKWLLYSSAFILSALIGLFSAYTLKIKDENIRKIFAVILFALLPIITITMTECLNNIWIYDMTTLGFAGNYVIILLLYCLVYSLSGSIKLCIFILSPIFYGFALAHAYIVSFRGTPFIPMDILGVTTAINVGSTYDYTPSDIVILGTLLFFALMVIAVKISMPKLKKITKIISRIFVGVFFVIMFIIFYFTDAFANAGIKPDFWNQSRGYRNYGFVYNFICNTKYIYYPKPKDYEPNDVTEMVDSNADRYEQNDANEKVPNIICIMNESLSDLSVLGNFTVSEDYMPFIRSLNENTIKGNLYVPVIGAGTSNTEFEFLTGHSTAFLPSGSNAYMLYIKNPIASIVSTLNAQGYVSSAFHPYFASGWNRVNVYNNMGFGVFKSIENLFDNSIMEEYTANSSNPDYLQHLIESTYPDRTKMLIRQYVSDSYDYKVLIDDYNNRDKSKPYFVFNVTMQNHGGYTTTASNFSADVTITSTEKQYQKATNYLSLVKQSDIAFKELIDYFKTVKEPTVICMFGDHQPSIETDFIAELLGVNDLASITIEQEQARHVTPFIIWANYDIEEKQIDKLSANYLSSYVLKTANVKLSKYNKYLLKLSETLPVIDTVGYIDKDNNYYKWSNESAYTKLLKEYELIQYNNIFDYENNDTDTFFINGYSVKEIEKIIEANNKTNENTDTNAK